MLATVWKGTLEFGLVSVPVRMAVAVKEKKVDVNLVNPKTGSGVSQQVVDQVTGQKLNRAELSRAVHVDARTAVVTKQELDALDAAPSTEIDLVSFVKLGEVDPIHFSGSFFLLPAADVDDSSYHLVAQALRGFGAVGTMVRLGRLRNILLRVARGGVLVLHTLHNAGEVRQAEELEPAAIDPRDLRLARRYVRAHTAPWTPGDLVDHHRQRLLELVAEKRREAAGDLTSELKSSVAKS
jgi:DNA end-binding protein Ku